MITTAACGQAGLWINISHQPTNITHVWFPAQIPNLSHDASREPFIAPQLEPPRIVVDLANSHTTQN